MKKSLLPFLFCFPLSIFAAQAATPFEEPRKISLYIPGFLMEMGSWFVPRDEEPELKEALSKMRSVSICVREGCAYKEFNTSGKYAKKLRKLERQNFEQLLWVTDAEEHVSIQLRQNNQERIRQFVILVDDGREEFLFLRVRCNIHPDELKRWIDNESISTKKVKNLVKT